MAKWFLVRDGQEHGPLTEQQLRELASKGQVQPTQKVRRDDMEKPVMAAKVQGLVFGNVAIKTSPQTTSTSQPTSQNQVSQQSSTSLQWYLVRNGQEHGPMTDQQLRHHTMAGGILATEYIRRSDMAAPVQAGAITGLTFGHTSVQKQALQGSGGETWGEKALIGLFALVIVGAVIGIQEFFKRKTATQQHAAPAAAGKAGTRRVFSSEDEFRRLVMGKSAAEVVTAVGRPDIVFSGGTFTNGVDYDESWGYKKILVHAATGLPQDLKVFFDDDHVVETKIY